ncbi:MAG: hypothetical protein NTU53_01765 [Planctomycetota bacterium]|nr:hypothetical protein [Planctomycetota bacterium]
MPRRRSTLLSAACCVLCLAMIIIWVESIWFSEVAWFTYGQGHEDHLHQFTLCSRGGKLTFATSRFTHYAPSGEPYFDWHRAHRWSFHVHRSRWWPATRTRGASGLRFPTTQPPRPIVTSWSLLGIVGGFTLAPPATAREIHVSVPYWLLTALLAFYPARRAWTRRRQMRRLRLGLCLTCGYDLRASKDRCPECGSPIPTNNE